MSHVPPGIFDRLHCAVQGTFLRISLVWHCHQMNSRSYVIRNRQFPLCARCTGIFFGLIFSPVWIWTVPRWSYVVAFLIFLLDGTTQYLGLRESRNLLRLSSGIAFS